MRVYCRSESSAVRAAEWRADVGPAPRGVDVLVATIY
jgi:hypothetical protein